MSDNPTIMDKEIEGTEWEAKESKETSAVICE